jgi:hypothetical protein
MYPDPYSFKPERYLLDGKLNPAVTDPDIVFGFGRRSGGDYCFSNQINRRIQDLPWSAHGYVERLALDRPNPGHLRHHQGRR